MALPEPLRPYFGLGKVRAGRVGVTCTVEGASVGPNTWIFPRLKVLAMGWLHALNWCQRGLEAACNRVPGLSNDSRVQDHRAPPPLTYDQLHTQ
eukprot:7953273-Pyramimonas_sp.AAC.1